MRYLTAGAILLINREEVGASSLMDWGRVDAAAYRPMHTIGGADAFPTIHEKAGALLHALVLSHPFSDGNKRTAWLAARMFYALNDWTLEADTEEVISFMVDVAQGLRDVPACALWLQAHATSRPSSAPSTGA
jgi:death-on-curing protein